LNFKLSKSYEQIRICSSNSANREWRIWADAAWECRAGACTTVPNRPRQISYAATSPRINFIPERATFTGIFQVFLSLFEVACVMRSLLNAAVSVKNAFRAEAERSERLSIPCEIDCFV
jgi:hypothetical protein